MSRVLDIYFDFEARQPTAIGLMLAEFAMIFETGLD